MSNGVECLVLLVLLMVLIYFGRTKLVVFYYNRGIDYYDRSLYEEAINSFNKSLRINPSRAVIHYMLTKELSLRDDAEFFADTVYLKNGRQISGRLKEEDEEKVVLEIKVGLVLGNITLYRNTIDKVVEFNAVRVSE